MKSNHRDLINLAKRMQLEVVGLEMTGGDHYRMRLKNTHGTEAFFVFANSCSDNKRAHKNNESLLRRFAEGLYDPRTKH